MEVVYMRSKWLVVIALLAIVVLGAGIVSAQDMPTSLTIGVSNSFVSSEWRTQMLSNLEEVAAQLSEDTGIDIQLVIESEDTDAAGQEQQILNLINRGVDGIIVNPGDAEALRLTLEDAVAQGIPVISIDQEVDGEGVINVVIDQSEWARISARWLAEQLGGEGKIVLIEGFVGHPANTARMTGVEEVLADYPGIEVVGRESGSWDQATGQQVMSDFLASLPQIDGVWTQDGMAFGVLNAIKTANPEVWPISSGEARADFMQEWAATREERPDFQTIGVVNPPGVAASGLRVLVNILTGKTVDETQLAGPFGNTLYVPIPNVFVNEDFTYTTMDGEEIVYPANFDQALEEIDGKAGSYTLDGIITQEEADAFFVAE
jgi:ribose transport system substrate-binding protein